MKTDRKTKAIQAELEAAGYSFSRWSGKSRLVFTAPGKQPVVMPKTLDGRSLERRMRQVVRQALL